MNDKNNMWFGFSIPHVMIIMTFLDAEIVIMEVYFCALNNYIKKTKL